MEEEGHRFQYQLDREQPKAKYVKELKTKKGKTECAVLQQHTSKVSLLHFEERKNGTAAGKKVRRDKKYTLVFTATKKKAGQLRDGTYIIASHLSYRLYKNGSTVTVMEIEAPRVQMIK